MVYGIWYDMVWYGLVWFGVVSHGMAWMAWHDTVCNDIVWHDMIWYDMVRHSTAWSGTAQHGTQWFGIGTHPDLSCSIAFMHTMMEASMVWYMYAHIHVYNCMHTEHSVYMN